MSKLMNLYTNLKNQNPNTLYLFKIGLFYNFLNDDAKKISNLLHLKLTNLSPEIIKCGFPYSSLNKYLKILSTLPYEFKIIDYSNSSTSNSYSIEEFKLDMSTKKLLEKISSIDTDTISVTEAYSLLDELKDNAVRF